jgi:hypothetical protein
LREWSGFIVPWFMPIIVFVVAFFPWWLCVYRRHSKRWRSTHLSNHPPMSDADFLKAMAISDDLAQRCLGLRQAAGNLAGVPRETIYPTDSLEYILSSGWDNHDLIELVMAVEQYFKSRIDRGTFDAVLVAALKDRKISAMMLNEYFEVLLLNWGKIFRNR